MLVKILIFIFAFLIMHPFLVETQIIEGFKRSKKMPQKLKSKSTPVEKASVVSASAMTAREMEKILQNEKKRCQKEINVHKSKIQNLEEQLANLEKAKELEDTEIDLDMDIIEEL